MFSFYAVSMSQRRSLERNLERLMVKLIVAVGARVRLMPPDSGLEKQSLETGIRKTVIGADYLVQQMELESVYLGLRKRSDYLLDQMEEPKIRPIYCYPGGFPQNPDPKSLESSIRQGPIHPAAEPWIQS